MRRVSDLPSDRVPARARPAASRPPSPACPACWTPGPLARSAGGRGRQGGARGSGARRGRVRAGGGGCVPARSREGVCNARSGPGGGAGLGPPALRSPMEGLREDTRARTQAGPALRPRVEKLLVVPAGRSSRSPELRVRDQYSLLPPKRTSADWVPTHLSPLSHLKKKSFDLSFSDSSGNPAPGTLSPVLFIQVVALLVLSEDIPQLLLDLEVGTFRFGGMITSSSRATD